MNRMHRAQTAEAQSLSLCRISQAAHDLLRNACYPLALKPENISDIWTNICKKRRESLHIVSSTNVTCDMYFLKQGWKVAELHSRWKDPTGTDTKKRLQN